MHSHDTIDRIASHHPKPLQLGSLELLQRVAPHHASPPPRVASLSDPGCARLGARRSSQRRCDSDRDRRRTGSIGAGATIGAGAPGLVDVCTANGPTNDRLSSRGPAVDARAGRTQGAARSRLQPVGPGRERRRARRRVLRGARPMRSAPSERRQSLQGLRPGPTRCTCPRLLRSGRRRLVDALHAGVGRVCRLRRRVARGGWPSRS